MHTDLEWKVLYVGSAHDARQDQVLDEILVGPVPVGINKFILEADPPTVSKLPPDEILGVTVVLIACSYKEREFVRVGFYVNNELLNHEPDQPIPTPLDVSQITRQILADKPRVTKFTIPWDSTETLNVATTEASLNVTPSTIGASEVEEAPASLES
jgi:histone chaperone ASF1